MVVGLAELVYAMDLKSIGVIHKGSNPLPNIMEILRDIGLNGSIYCVLFLYIQILFSITYDFNQTKSIHDATWIPYLMFWMITLISLLVTVK